MKRRTRSTGTPESATSAIGFSGLAGVLPAHSLSLEELAATGKINSSPEVLAQLGFDRAYISDESEPAWELARRAAQEALDDAGLKPAQIDVVIWASALAENHLRPSLRPGTSVLHQFTYAASWLQEELGMEKASVTATAQQGCAGMFSALRQARALLLAEPELEHVLCVGADVLPSTASREILYNVISDAACAVIVSRHESRERWVAFHQITRGYYWDTPASQKEIMAAYFPTSQLLLRELLEKSGLAPESIDRFISTGVNAPSWPILLRLAGLPEAILHKPRRRFGHTIAADNFLYLQEIRKSGQLFRGSRLLLFTYGFGSSWSGLILDH